MISVTLYTLITVSSGHVRPAAGLLRPACHRPRGPAADRTAHLLALMKKGDDAFNVGDRA
jgi:hypothetical protein